MTDWHAVLPPPAVATAMMRIPQQTDAKRVTAPANSGNIGSDANNRHPRATAQIRHPVVVPPQPDTDRPTGPPPAFEANVLEAEAERRRSRIAGDETGIPEALTDKDKLETGRTKDGSSVFPGNRPVPDNTGTGPYSDLPALADLQLDLIR